MVYPLLIITKMTMSEDDENAPNILATPPRPIDRVFEDQLRELKNHIEGILTFYEELKNLLSIMKTTFFTQSEYTKGIVVS